MILTPTTLSLTQSGPLDYKRLIHDQLCQVGGDCIPSTFATQIDLQWRLLAGQSAGDHELHYYLVRAEMLKALMICAARSVDEVRAVQTDNTFANAKMRAEGTSQSVSSNNEVSFVDTLGKKRYSDLTTGLRDTASNRAGYSISRNQIWTDFDDDGRGARFSQNLSNAANTGLTDSFVVDNEYELGIGEERRRGCSYQFNWTRTRGGVISVIIGGIGRTGTRTSWGLRSFQASDSRHSDQMAHVGTTETHGGKDRIRNAWTKVSSWSNAFANTITQGVAHLENKDTLTSSRDSRSSGSGAGFDQEEMRGRGNSQSQTDATSHDERKAEAVRREEGSTHRDDIKNNQRFQALKRMYDQTVQLINHRRSEIAAIQYAFGCMTPVCGGINAWQHPAYPTRL